MPFGGLAAIVIAGGSNHCGFLKYVLEDLEEKIQKNTGELMGEYYRKRLMNICSLPVKGVNNNI